MKNILSVIFLLCVSFLPAQITLTHNVGNTPIYTGMPNCQYDEHWARVFTLSDFGIRANEQFIIRSGQTAISNSYQGAIIGISVYVIDSNFPISNPRYLGGGITYAPEIGDSSEIINVNFNHPIVVTEEIERILVVVNQSDDNYNPNYKEVLIAGTENDTGVSWFSGCREYYDFTPTTELNNPVPNANFFINVTGEVFNKNNFDVNTTLTHNICDKPVWVNQYGCTGGGINFSRRFVMDNFGVSSNEEFVIYNGQAAFSGVGAWDVRVLINIYKIDSNFPTSFSDLDLLGSSEILSLPYSSDRSNPRIFNFNFPSPVVVPNNAEAILVEVKHLGSSGYSAAFIAGTEQDNDVSWIKSDASGCPPFGVYEPRNISYYINVTGNVNHVTNSFEMNFSNICSEFLKEFSVENKDDIASVIWDFGDPASGVNNTSTDLSPFHDFSSDGTYTIIATVTANNRSVEVLTETIDVKEPPNAYGINNIEACEDSFGTGFSASFDTSNIQSQVLGNQIGRVVTYIDGSGSEYDLLPNPFTNTVSDRETITVRVARNEELCCYSETTFDLIVNPLPFDKNIENVLVCDDDYDGFGFFDFTKIKNDILIQGIDLDIKFFYEDGTTILDENLSSVKSMKADIEEFIVQVTNIKTKCSVETTFTGSVEFKPIAFELPEILGCDDNGDGISEYFDLSNVKSIVMGNQSGLDVNYYDSLGNSISPSNPYTNTTLFQEELIVRLTFPHSKCFTETNLILKTSNKPQINTPQDIYTCDEGDGFSTFNLASIENEVIGNQTNLNVYYYDDSGKDITNNIDADFQNTKAWAQTISVKVENALSNLCVSETSFNLIVNELPEIELESDYFLCNLEPSLPIQVNSSLDSYEWKFEDGTVISNNYKTTLTNAGSYTLKITEINNGITCENTYNFKLIRSVLPKIENVEYQELSDNNYIKINASGDGDFQYSISGNIYQNSNEFSNVLGGVYTVYVRDKFGCGQDSKEITVIDYPKYFTPNNDGENDYWQIKGIKSYPNAKIIIYDRYGKLLKQISANSMGWDGTFNGKIVLSSDYWFTINLDGERSFTGHFSLKR